MPGKSIHHPSSFVDELADFHQQFVIADPHLIYMDGNSLGRLPAKAAAEDPGRRRTQQPWLWPG